MVDNSSVPDIAVFRRSILEWFAINGRELPWRKQSSTYGVFVSEIMLQQTQVNRVALLYPPFMKVFPTFRQLAEAPLADVLRHWSGLGYNRRGKWLREAAIIIDRDYNGRLPKEPSVLVSLPGVGKATAASIAAFAYDQPTIFLETNIRAVFLHHFFADAEGVPDADLLPLVEAALDREAPGRWYSALMDYGTELKRLHGNPTRRSATHKKQSAFEGSLRQIRGGVIKALTNASHPMTGKGLQRALGCDSERLALGLNSLIKDGMVTKTSKGYRLGSS